MRISTLDPISMRDVLDTDTAPYVIEAAGPNTLKIYFENEINKTKYINIPQDASNTPVTAAYVLCADKDTTDSIN